MLAKNFFASAVFWQALLPGSFQSYGQSFHSVTFSGAASDFSTVEKISAAANNTDYYITFDANNLYIGAFRTSGSFGGTDNLAAYIDTDPNPTTTNGTGTTTGQTYNGVTGTLPFSANYNIHVEQNYQEARSFGSNWAASLGGLTYWTNSTAREVKIPFSIIGDPKAVYITVWMGYANGFFSNAPGSNLSASANPTITSYFGGIGLSSADCIPVNIINTPITDGIINAVPVSGATYGAVVINAGSIAATADFNIAPGGSISVAGGVFDISGRTVVMGGGTIGDGRGTAINSSGAGIITMNAATTFIFNGEGNVTGNSLSVNGNIRINKKFTPLFSGGLTFANGSSLDIRNGGYLNSNTPTYSNGSTLKYNSGSTYVASTEWTPNSATGTGVPYNVTIGDLVANSGLSFGSSALYRQANGNVTVSNSTTGSSLILSSVSGGDLSVAGNFINNGTFTHNNRGITFNGTTTQTISGTLSNGSAATNILTNVTIANTSANVTASSNINISGGITINLNARLDIGSTILILNTGSTSTVNGYLRSAGTVTTNGSLIFSATGTYEHNFTASGLSNLGTIPTATWSAGSTCKIIGLTNPNSGSWFFSPSANQSFSNFVWNTPSLGSANSVNMSGATLTVNGNFSMISTGSAELRVGTGTTTGAINCGSYSQTGGVLNLSNGSGTGTINCTGTFTQTAGTITELSNGSGVINLIQSSGTQNLSVNGSVNNNVAWNIGSGSTTNTVQLLSNLAAGDGAFNVLNNASINFGSYILSGTNTFNLQSGASLITANVNGIYTSTAMGSVQSTGVRTFNAAANYSFNSSSAQVTGTGLTAANNLTINNSNGVTLTTNAIVSNLLTLQSGSLSLAVNNITITNNAASAITGYSSANYIKTNGTGELKRTIAITGLPVSYVFPIGITSYTPVSYNFTDNTVATNLGLRVVENTHPSVSTTDYIQNRYWITSLSDATGTYTYSATYNFVSGDVTGTQSNIKLTRWNGSSWGSITSSTCTGTTLTSGTITESSGPLQSTAEWCGRSSPTPTTYAWNISGIGSWNNAANWSPAGVPGDGDAVSFNNGSNSVVTNVPTGIRLTKFSVSANTTVTLQAASSGILNIGGGTIPQFNVAVSSTLIIGSNTGLTVNILSGNTGSVQGFIQLKEGAHKITAESASGLIFNSGSYFAAGVSGQTGYSGNPFGNNSTLNTIIFQSGSTFEQFEGSNPFALTQPSSKVSFQVGSLYKFSNTNAIASPSFSGRTYANFEYNVDQSKSVSGSNGFSMQSLTISQGSFTITLTGTSSIAGDISISDGASLDIAPLTSTTYYLNGSLQTITVTGTGVFSLGANAILNVVNGTTVNMVSESVINGGGAFIASSGSTLVIASANGISASGLTGHIQTTVRSFNIAANYIYNGSYNQVTGTGLPSSLTGTLTIANTGSVGNNTLTLSNSGSSAGILNLSSGYFAIGAGQQFNMNNASIVNGTGGDFSSGVTGGTLIFNGSGTFSGNLKPYNVYISGGLNFGTGTVTIQSGGTFRINSGGYVNINAPYYETGSFLQYYSGGIYNLANEWSSLAGRGYPYNIMLSNNTTLNYPYGGNVARTISGNLQIDAGSSLYMDYGSPATSTSLTVKGSLILDGNLSLGDASGGDLNIAGNWKSTGSFTHNNREVVFNGTSLQTITGTTTFAYLKIKNTGNTVQANSNINIESRLWLNSGTFDPNGKVIMMAGGSEVRRSSSSATMTQSPTANTGNSFDMRYDATLTTGKEFLNDQDKIRDIYVDAGTLTLDGDRTFNRDLKLNADLDLSTYKLTSRGNTTASTGSGKIEITGGNRIITGSSGAIFDIAGGGGNNPAYYTKVVTNPSGTGKLSFGNNVLVRIADGRMDFGNGSPVTINGVLQIGLGGSVYPNPCYYGVNSILRFANLVDYQVFGTDITWSSGAINSGLPGIPYHVEVLNNGTDLTLQSPRQLRGDLTIIDGTFTMTNASGTFTIGGNWFRSGGTSAFNHNNQKVIFNNQLLNTDQTITTSDAVSGETFYDIETALNGGSLQLEPNTNLTILDNLNFNSGNVAINDNTINLNGTVTSAGGSFTGSIASNIIVNGTTGGSAGTLNFTSGYSMLNNLTVGRTGAGATVALGTDVEVKGTLTITNPATLTMGSSGQLLTISGYISGTGTLTGSTGSNLTIAGSGANAGTLHFTSGSQLLDGFRLVRTGTAPAAVMGTSLTANALILNKGILSTGNNLLTITTGSGIAFPGVYSDSYVCLCNATGTSPVSFTKPYDGSVGLRINSVGNSDNYFPVGVDFVSPNKMWLKNYGAVDDITVAMEKGDIGYTERSRVNRIWYVKQSNPGTKYVTADMRLYFTKRDWTTDPFSSAQDEIENGFLWNDIRLVQKNYYDPNYLNVAQYSDVNNGTANSYGTELYGQYTYGVSPDVSALKNGIDTFTRFSVVNIYQFILPVKMINLKAAKIGRQIRIDWTSLNEINVAQYEIERSHDPTGFIAAGTVLASNKGAQKATYSFFDPDALSGNNYYRVKAVDKDGRVAYSSVVNVYVAANELTAIYPNPVSKGGSLNISIAKMNSGKCTVVLTDMNGREIAKKEAQHYGGYFYLLYKLPGYIDAGTYFITIISSDKVINQKIIIY